MSEVQSGASACPADHAMPSAANPSKLFDSLARAEGFYWALMQHAGAVHVSADSAEPGLGGKFLYAGKMDDVGRALVSAGNVAGAATLAATADGAAQRLAIREGVVDFLVTSLDEALRILKNEIRKHEPVAVCVAAAPEDVEREMLERGVQPDLLAKDDGGRLCGAAFLSRDTARIGAAPVNADDAWLAWSVADAPALWMPKLDALVLECLLSDETVARRWLQYSPRYMGRMARGARVLRCPQESARAFTARVRDEVGLGAIDVQVRLSVHIGEERTELELRPPAVPQRAG